AFGLIAPNIFAITGIIVAHVYSMAVHQPMEIGTYVLFAVLCGAASYIAVPAVQRLAIPQASPTLPPAASLRLTFSYNRRTGIPFTTRLARLFPGSRKGAAGGAVRPFAFAGRRPGAPALRPVHALRGGGRGGGPGAGPPGRGPPAPPLGPAPRFRGERRGG